MLALPASKLPLRRGEVKVVSIVIAAVECRTSGFARGPEAAHRNQSSTQNRKAQNRPALKVHWSFLLHRKLDCNGGPKVTTAYMPGSLMPASRFCIKLDWLMLRNIFRICAYWRKS